jgi:hypothetical protein
LRWRLYFWDSRFDRAGEARRLKQDGYEPVLKHSRWCLLKRPENLSQQQTVKLAELLRYNLQSVRAYLHREDFQRFWQYQSPAWAGKFLDEWCARVMRSRLEPLKKVARSLRKHRSLLLNWFRAKGTISAGIVEGFNNKAKLTMRKSYGFREYETIELALEYERFQRLFPEAHVSLRDKKWAHRKGAAQGHGFRPYTPKQRFRFGICNSRPPTTPMLGHYPSSTPRPSQSPSDRCLSSRVVLFENRPVTRLLKHEREYRFTNL